MFKSFLMAFQNLTRLYITTVDFDEEKFGRGTAFFPLVGLLLGIILYAVQEVSLKYFSSSVAAAIILVSLVILTGGMHLDGFMDSMDGLFSGRNRERKLEIMKDSRVGANGVMALVSLFILKYALINNIIELHTYPWLIFMPAVSRWSMVYAIKFFQYARSEGLGKAYSKYTGLNEFTIATLTILLAGFFLFGYDAFAVFILIWIITHLLANGMSKTLGGLTGDTYGAINEIIEVVFLIVYTLMNPVLRFV